MAWSPLHEKNALIYMIIAKEQGVTSIRAEIKRSFADKTIRTTGPTTWNSIDDKVKKAISTNHFQKSFKSLLIDMSSSSLCILILIIIIIIIIFFDISCNRSTKFSFVFGAWLCLVWRLCFLCWNFSCL